MQKHIYFVRHGESDSNKDGILRAEDSVLSALGHKQADLVAKRIERIGVEALIASTYERAIETATHIREHINLPIETSDLFIECKSPSARKGMQASDPAAMEMTTKVFEGYAIPGYRHSDEENADDLLNRANAALLFLANHPSNRICVVTHGLFMRVLLGVAVFGNRFSGAELQDMIRALQTNNTNVSHFVFQEDPFVEDVTFRWYIENWNDSSHLG